MRDLLIDGITPFDSAQNVGVTEFQTMLVPYLHIHTLLCTHAPSPQRRRPTTEHFMCRWRNGQRCFVWRESHPSCQADVAVLAWILYKDDEQDHCSTCQQCSTNLRELPQRSTKHPRNTCWNVPLCIPRNVLHLSIAKISLKIPISLAAWPSTTCLPCLTSRHAQSDN